jgi:hypothetical protein
MQRHAYDDPIEQFDGQVSGDAPPQHYFRANQQDDHTPSHVSNFGRYQHSEPSAGSSSNGGSLRRDTTLHATGRSGVPRQRERSQPQSQHLP